MTSILAHLFQSDLVFPMDPVEEQRFAALGNRTQERRDDLEKQLTEEKWTQVRAYLELLEEFHDRERRLAYENGFLLAVSLCLELSRRLEGMRE